MCNVHYYTWHNVKTLLQYCVEDIKMTQIKVSLRNTQGDKVAQRLRCENILSISIDNALSTQFIYKILGLNADSGLYADMQIHLAGVSADS